jgi:hypothetical protein
VSRAPITPPPARWYHPAGAAGRSIVVDLVVPALFAAFMAAFAAALVATRVMIYVAGEGHWLVFAVGGVAFLVGGATGAYQTGKLLRQRG